MGSSWSSPSETSSSPSTSALVEESVENESDFAKPDYDGSVYSNPRSFSNWTGIPGARAILKWRMIETDMENVPTNKQDLNSTIPVVPLKEFKGKSDLFATWLGHATVLVHLEGLTLITDPVWCHRASPLPSLVGSKRYRPPPMAISDLPEIDVGVISHDHYDHLDVEAVKTIADANPRMRWFVPLGLKDWFYSIDIVNDDAHPHRITEMNWGESSTVLKDGKSYDVWCLPAQHWGQRFIFDRNKRLWAGWAVVGPSRRFYYSGDTGFCDKEMAKIGAKLGPFDLAAIPIGAYEPRWFMKSQHINPEEAIQVHELVRSKMSLGIHWGTYHMGSYEYYLEPRDKLKELMSTRSELFPFKTIHMGNIWEAEDKQY